jgi:hypothetical protein
MLKLVTAPLQTMVPEKITEQMRTSLKSLVDIVQRANEWSIPIETVLGETPYGSLEELQEEAPIQDIRKLCLDQSGPAILKATLQGAGLGFGGVFLAAVDIPILLMAHLKLLTRIGLCCGVDLCNAQERGFLLNLLKLSYCLSDPEEKQASIRELWQEMSGSGTSKGEESEEIARAVFFKSIGTFSDKIGPILLRREAGTLIPLFGSAVGAGSNYLLTQDVATAGRHTLMKRLLTQRVQLK